MDATLRGSDYRTVSNFQTSGAVSAFWQSEIQATSSGKIGAKSLEPGLYDSFDINRTGKKQEVSLTYENGSPRLYADPVYSTTGYEVKPEEQKNTMDPLSALTFIVSGVAADGGNPCALTAPVFDGRRLYNIEMTKVKDTDIKMDNGLYAGKATQCQIRYRPLAGMKPRVLKSGESFPVINAWVVNYPSGVAGRSFAVPVRVWADTQYGQLSVVANSIKIDGQSTQKRLGASAVDHGPSIKAYFFAAAPGSDPAPNAPHPGYWCPARRSRPRPPPAAPHNPAGG